MVVKSGLATFVFPMCYQERSLKFKMNIPGVINSTIKVTCPCGVEKVKYFLIFFIPKYRVPDPHRIIESGLAIFVFS